MNEILPIAFISALPPHNNFVTKKLQFLPLTVQMNTDITPSLPQVSIWRNYWQKSMRDAETKTSAPATALAPTVLAPPKPAAEDTAWIKELLRDRAVHAEFPAPALQMMQAAHATAASRVPGGYTGERVGLVLPTSLCSSSIAKMCADRLNDWLNDAKGPTYFSRLVPIFQTISHSLGIIMSLM